MIQARPANIANRCCRILAQICLKTSEYKKLRPGGTEFFAGKASQKMHRKRNKKYADSTE